MHNVVKIDVAVFPDSPDCQGFARIAFTDDRGNAVTIFTDNMDRFLDDICAAGARRRQLVPT